MLRRVDLHTHSNASDGTDTPAELVAKAHAAGLAAVAITDHDTLSGLPEAEKEAQKYPDMEFVRGVEVSTGSDHGEMHILGLWVPRDAEPLENALAEMRAKRGERNARIVEKLCRLGCPLSMDDVMKEAGGESVGRPHIAMALITKGYVRSMKEAFDRLRLPSERCDGAGEGRLDHVAYRMFRCDRPSPAAQLPSGLDR